MTMTMTMTTTMSSTVVVGVLFFVAGQLMCLLMLAWNICWVEYDMEKWKWLLLYLFFSTAGMPGCWCRVLLHEFCHVSTSQAGPRSDESSVHLRLCFRSACRWCAWQNDNGKCLGKDASLYPTGKWSWLDTPAWQKPHVRFWDSPLFGVPPKAHNLPHRAGKSGSILGWM